LACAPVLPVFGSGRALVQPVSIHDLVAALTEILDGDAFDNQTVEIGGPEVLSMEELLVKIRRVHGKGNGPVFHLPAKLLAAGIGVVESFLLPLLPFTAGQMASFTNDGVADRPARGLVEARINVDRMLTS
jgi:NADH dehydrogenase